MNLPMHILLLDDDPDLCSIVIDQLQIDNEFIVSHYDKIRNAVQTIVTSQIDLILVSSVVLRRETNEIINNDSNAFNLRPFKHSISFMVSGNMHYSRWND